MSDNNIQWHPAFVGGIELALRNYKNELTFESEHPLSKKPLQMDMLVVKKNADLVIDNAIGRIFRMHNVLEYKSPDDGLTIDDFYKVMAYACLYKSLASHVDEIPGDEISMSLFRDNTPVQMFKDLQKLGSIIEEKEHGIYYITGMINMPVQVVVISELEDTDSVALRVLSQKARSEDVLAFTELIGSLKDKDDKENADAVYQVSMAANRETYEDLKGGYPEVFEAMKEFMKPEIDQMIEDSKLESIKNVMESFKVTPQQAMDALKIPPAEQAKYQAKL